METPQTKDMIVFALVVMPFIVILLCAAALFAKASWKLFKDI